MFSTTGASRLLAGDTSARLPFVAGFATGALVAPLAAPAPGVLFPTPAIPGAAASALVRIPFAGFLTCPPAGATGLGLASGSAGPLGNELKIFAGGPGT